MAHGLSSTQEEEKEEKDAGMEPKVPPQNIHTDLL